MKGLYLSLKPPYPIVDGGTLAIEALVHDMLSVCDTIEMLSISTNKHPYIKEKFPRNFHETTNFQHVKVNTDLSPIDALKYLILNKPYNYVRFYNVDFEQIIENKLKNNHYDLVILDSLFMANYLTSIRNNSQAKVIVRSHNIEHEIWENKSKNSKNIFKKWYFKKIAKQLKKVELDAFNKTDIIFSISNKDTEFIKKNTTQKVETISISFSERTKHEAIIIDEKINFYHLGAMDWEPNIEAVDWLLDYILTDKITKTSTIFIAGKNMPQRLLNQNTGIKIEGYVKDIDRYIEDKHVLLVPLLSGSGIRVKIIEAMSMGKAIISTSKGAEGINIKETGIIIADSVKDFRTSILELNQNPNLVKTLGEKNIEYFNKYHNRKVIEQRLKSFFQNLNISSHD